MRLRLDARTTANIGLPAGKTEEIYWDTDVKGFGLRVRRTGDGGLVRTWITFYRANGHARRVTVGDSNKLTAPQAREAAKKIFARVAFGHDPQAEKRAARRQEAHTVKGVVEAYLAAKQPELRPVSFRLAKLYLTGLYFKALHPLAVTNVTRSDVAACVRTVTRTHSAPTAAAARRHLSALFSWAIADGLLGDGANPVDGSHRPADPTPRDRVLSDSEVVAVWNACRDDDYGRVVRLLILLGNRASEVGGMRWSEFDLEAGTWTLPAERSKNKHSCTVTLPAPALAIVNSVPHTTRDCLFGARGQGFVSWSEAKKALDRWLGDSVRKWRLHDVRRTVATRMADVGIEPHVIEAVLNHYSGHRSGVAGTYNRSKYERAVAEALARWSEHVLALVEGRKSKVVALRRQ
jgi:integrase